MDILFKSIVVLAVMAAVGMTLPSRASGASGDRPIKLLAVRETALTGLKFDWKLYETVSGYGNQDPDRETAYVQLAKQMADQFDFKNSEEKAEFVQREISSNRMDDEPYTLKNKLLWTFESDKRSVLVSAQTKGQATHSAFRVVLGPDKRMVIQDEYKSDKSDNALAAAPIELFATHSPAWCYRDPGTRVFTVTPEQTCMFCGKNPLMIYGAAWKTVLETSASEVIEATYEKGQYAPYTLTVHLDKQHDACPVKIEFNSKARSETYIVTDFVQYNKTWIPKSVRCTVDQHGMYHVDQAWSLDGISKAPAIKIVLAGDSDVVDYRLLGPDVTVGGIIYDEQQSDHRYVPYQFRSYAYKVPSLDDLARMRETFILHRAPTATKKSSAVPVIWLVLGLASIAAGVVLVSQGRKREH